jgi:hypothetical protein
MLKADWDHKFFPLRRSGWIDKIGNNRRYPGHGFYARDKIFAGRVNAVGNHR